MGLFTYSCSTHGAFKVSLPTREPNRSCPECGAAALPVLRGGTVRVVEVLDNGLMGRKVERLHNIEEILDERADKDSARAGYGEEDPVD